MAIALTPFRGFLNFVPPAILLNHILNVPELASVIPSEAVEQLAKSLNLPNKAGDEVASAAAKSHDGVTDDAQKKALKAVFEAVMCAPKDKYVSAIKSLVQRYESGKVGESEKDLVDLVLLLNKQYPDDVGTLCSFLLNVVDLKTGEAIFLGANVPHAYISGGEY